MGPEAGRLGGRRREAARRHPLSLPTQHGPPRPATCPARRAWSPRPVSPGAAPMPAEAGGRGPPALDPKPQTASEAGGLRAALRESSFEQMQIIPPPGPATMGLHLSPGTCGQGTATCCSEVSKHLPG